MPRRKTEEIDRLAVEILHRHDDWMNLSQLARALNPQSRRTHLKENARVVERLYASGYLRARKTGREVQIRLHNISALETVSVRRIKGLGRRKLGVPRPNTFRFWKLLEDKDPEIYFIITPDRKRGWCVSKDKTGESFPDDLPLRCEEINMRKGKVEKQRFNMSKGKIEGLHPNLIAIAKESQLPEDWQKRDYLAYCYTYIETKPAPWIKSLSQGGEYQALKGGLDPLIRAIGSVFLFGSSCQWGHFLYPMREAFQADFHAALTQVLKELGLNPLDWDKEALKTLQHLAINETSIGLKIWKLMNDIELQTQLPPAD